MFGTESGQLYLFGVLVALATAGGGIVTANVVKRTIVGGE